MDTLLAITVTGLLLALALLLAAATAFGIALAVRPAAVERLRARLDRRLDTDAAVSALDRPWNMDSWLYRYHHLYGIVVIAMAAFILWFLAFGYDSPAWVAGVGADHREIALILAEVARFLLWIGAMAGVILGTVILVRPSALKGVEQWANRWIAPQAWRQALDREYHPADAWFQRYPRASGIAVAIAAGALLIALLLHWGAITGAAA